MGLCCAAGPSPWVRGLEAGSSQHLWECPVWAHILPIHSAEMTKLVVNIWPFTAHRCNRRGMTLRLVVTHRYWPYSNQWLLILLPLSCCTRLPTCTARYATRRHSRNLLLRDGLYVPHLPHVGLHTLAEIVVTRLQEGDSLWTAGIFRQGIVIASLSTHVHMSRGYFNVVTRGDCWSAAMSRLAPGYSRFRPTPALPSGGCRGPTAFLLQVLPWMPHPMLNGFSGTALGVTFTSPLLLPLVPYLAMRPPVSVLSRILFYPLLARR